MTSAATSNPMVQYVTGASQHHLWNEMISAPHAEAGVRRHPANVDRYVACGITATNDQDRLA